MDVNQRIEDFLSQGPWAVAGASTDREKYGNKVLRAYQQQELEVYAVNPRAEQVEGVTSYPDVDSLPDDVQGLSIVTPPAVTEQVVEAAARKGIRKLWMQPGAESARAVERAGELGLSVISGGPCALVKLGFREPG
jgi:predicted CoA-binding protein